MKPLYYIGIFAALVGGAWLYMYLSYAHIYHKIGNAHLVFPHVEQLYTIGNSSGGAPETYVSLGDSLTAGVGVDSYTESYPYTLAEKLAVTSKIHLRNFAYPGAKTRDVIAGLPAALEAKPDIVTLLIGTNDIHDKISAAQFETNYRLILDELTQKTKADIYAVSIPFIGSRTLLLPPYNYYFDYRTAELNDVIQRVAAEYKIPYVDIATPTRALFKADGPLYAADSFHPSAAGYQLWSDILYANINR